MKVLEQKIYKKPYTKDEIRQMIAFGKKTFALSQKADL